MLILFSKIFLTILCRDGEAHFKSPSNSVVRAPNQYAKAPVFNHQASGTQMIIFIGKSVLINFHALVMQKIVSNYQSEEKAILLKLTFFQHDVTESCYGQNNASRSRSFRYAGWNWC